MYVASGPARDIFSFMFKRMAAEALGISDIGAVISPADFDKVDSDDFLFHEDGERIFFLVKSKKDEYCFTNFAFIHVDGDSAVSNKRSVKRYEYATSEIDDVSIETAGRVDLDVELKFTVNGVLFSIDISKQFLEQLKDIYKALFTMRRVHHHANVEKANALLVLDTIGQMHKLNSVGSDAELVSRYNALVDAANSNIRRLSKRDYSEVFDTYIHS
jgi:Bacterial PH domain